MILTLQIFSLILIILIIVLTNIIIYKEIKEIREEQTVLNKENNQNVSMSNILTRL